MDVEKTIEQMLAVQAKLQADHVKWEAAHAAFREEFWSNMAELGRSQAVADARMDRADARMDRADARMDRADARMDRFDKQLQATRKLVEAGMKIVTRLAQTQASDRKNFDYKINALIQAQDRLVKSLLHQRSNGRS